MLKLRVIISCETLNRSILAAKGAKPKNSVVTKIKSSMALTASFHHYFPLPYLLIYFYVICSSLATHVCMASSTALVRSPFLPPNRSMVLNLSSFSNSSGISTYIWPISTPSTINSANELYFSSSI